MTVDALFAELRNDRGVVWDRTGQLRKAVDEGGEWKGRENAFGLGTPGYRYLRANTAAERMSGLQGNQGWLRCFMGILLTDAPIGSVNLPLHSTKSCKPETCRVDGLN